MKNGLDECATKNKKVLCFPILWIVSVSSSQIKIICFFLYILWVKLSSIWHSSIHPVQCHINMLSKLFSLFAVFFFIIFSYKKFCNTVWQWAYTKKKQKIVTRRSYKYYIFICALHTGKFVEKHLSSKGLFFYAQNNFINSLGKCLTKNMHLSFT